MSCVSDECEYDGGRKAGILRHYAKQGPWTELGELHKPNMLNEMLIE